MITMVVVETNRDDVTVVIAVTNHRCVKWGVMTAGAVMMPIWMT